MWQTRDQTHRPPCIVNKSDSAKHVLSSSSVVIAACLLLQ